MESKSDEARAGDPPPDSGLTDDEKILWLGVFAAIFKAGQFESAERNADQVVKAMRDRKIFVGDACHALLGHYP